MLPLIPTTEPMLIILPHLRRIICLTTARRAVEHAIEVCRDDSVPGIIAHANQKAIADDASVIDKYVYLVESLVNLVNHSRDLVEIAHIRLDWERIDSEFMRGPLPSRPPRQGSCCS